MSFIRDYDFSFTWFIENFSTFTPAAGVCFTSPYFTVEVFEYNIWSMSICPGGIDETDETFITCILRGEKNESEDSENNYIICDAQLNTINRKLLKAEHVRFVETRNCDAWICCFERDEVLEELKKCCSDTLTVRCLLRATEDTKRSPKDIKVRTRITSYKNKFECNVNFIEDSICTKREFIFSLCDSIYELRITVLQEGFMFKVNKRYQNTSTFHPITGRITLLDVHGNKCFTTKSSHKFCSQVENGIWEFPSLISKELLLNNLDNYVKYGTVVFLCKFSTPKVCSTGIDSHHETSFDIENILNLCDDFRSLLSSKNYSDVELRVGDKIWPAHKTVLAARSSVFSSMFNQEWIEKKSGVLDITDIDTNTMESFLEFLYTGRINDLNCDNAAQLMLVAQKYQVLSLREKCSSILMSSICVVNVCKILVLADMVGHDNMKDICEKFIAQNVAEIFPSEEWSQLVTENPRLSSEVIAYIGRNCDITFRFGSNK